MTRSILGTCALANEQLVAMASALHSLPEVKQVDRALDCRAYESGPVIEAYVDAELSNGRALSWGTTISCRGDRWLIESELRLAHEMGQDLVQSFGTREVLTMEDFAREVTLAVSDLALSMPGAIREYATNRS